MLLINKAAFKTTLHPLTHFLQYTLLIEILHIMSIKSFSIFALSLMFTTALAADLRFRSYSRVTIEQYAFPYRSGGGSFDSCVQSPTSGVGNPSFLVDFFTVGQVDGSHRGPYAGLNDSQLAKSWGFLRNTWPKRWDCSIGK